VETASASSPQGFKRQMNSKDAPELKRAQRTAPPPTTHMLTHPFSSKFFINTLSVCQLGYSISAMLGLLACHSDSTCSKSVAENAVKAFSRCPAHEGTYLKHRRVLNESLLRRAKDKLNTNVHGNKDCECYDTLK